MCPHDSLPAALTVALSTELDWRASDTIVNLASQEAINTNPEKADPHEIHPRQVRAVGLRAGTAKSQHYLILPSSAIA